MVSNVFPELNVVTPVKIKMAPYRGYWKEISNQRAFFDKLAKLLSINGKEEEMNWKWKENDRWSFPIHFFFLYHCLPFHTLKSIKIGTTFHLSKSQNLEEKDC